MNILFKNVRVITMDDEVPYIENAYVVVSDKKISYVGNTMPEGGFSRIIDASGKVMMPGFVNTHTHIPMTLFRGLSDDCELSDWLFNHIFPAEDKLTGEKVLAGTKLALAEMIASGTTSFSDSYFFTDEIAEATVQSGICANLSRSIVGNGEDFENMPSVSEMKRLLEYVKENGDGRVIADISIHAEYTTEALCRIKTAEYAKKNNLILQIHTSETESEHKNCIEKYGKTPVELFASEGLLEGTYPLLAHCCYITENDMEILKSYNGHIAHCPMSNLKLASGVAPVPEMLRRGVNVTLGTDGVASNNNTDMFEEMKLFAVLHKGIEKKATVTDAYVALKIATANGNLAQGRKNCGKIAEGYFANLILVDFERPHLVPCHNVISNIVYAAIGSDVVMTMVHGRVLYENNEFKTIDIEKAMYNVKGIK